MILSGKILLWFFCLWISFGLTLFVYAYVWLIFAGATRSSGEDIKSMLEGFSVPLGFISGRFVLRADTGFGTALGICMANAYFYALVILPGIRFVQWRMASNRVTQLGLSSEISDFDTSELVSPPEENDQHEPGER